MPSQYLRIASDGTDLGYNKAVLDATVAPARTGDRRTYPTTNPTGSFSYPNASGVLTVRASFPRTYLDTDTLTLTGKTVRAATNDATFAAALSAAGASSTPSVITVAPGTYTNTYSLPTRVGSTTPGGANIVIIIGLAIYNSMIANGGVSTVCPAKKRVTATDVASFPFFKNVSLANAEQWAINAGTSGWRFIGIRFGIDPTVSLMSRIMRIGNGNTGIQTSASQCPQNIVIDRCGFDGHATVELKCALEMHGINQACIDSYFGDDIHHSGQDCQAIRQYNGPGPTKIVGNRLVGSTENVMIGGALSQCGLPSDLEFRYNELLKPASWNPNHPSYAGVNWDIKNLFEVKACAYALIEGNYLHGTWPDGQAGAAMLLKAESYGNGATIGYTNNILARWNLIEDAGFGLNVAGISNVDPAQPPVNICSYGNLWVIGAQYYSASANPFFGAGRFQNCGLIHDTFISKGPVNAISQPGNSAGYYAIDTIFDATGNGLKGSSVFEGTATLEAYCLPGYDVRKSIFTQRTSAGNTVYPPGNFFPTTAAMHAEFTDWTNGNYSLLGTTQTSGGPATPVATGISITTQPSDISTGGTVTVVARITDQFGAPFSATATMTASVASGTGSIVSGSTASTNSSGVATFSIPMSASATTACTLTVSSTGLTSATTSSFTITVTVAPAATSLSFTTQPTNTVSGATMSSVVVKVLDQFGAVFASSATVTLASASGAATYTGTSAVAVNGVATFSSLVPTTSTTGANTLTATSAGLAQATSSSFTVTAPVTAVATSLFITQQPGNGVSGTALATQPVVKVLDQFGALYPHGGIVVTASIASGTATITAGATKTTVSPTGTATFTVLTLTDSVQSSDTITFSAPGLASVTSNAITITPVRVATSLGITRQPSGATSDIALTTQPIVVVLDQFGSIISSTATITASVGTGSATVTAGSTKAATAGSATFAGLTLNAVSTNAVTLFFSSPGLTGISSASFTVTVPAVPVATSLAIVTQPSGSTSGVALTTQPVIRILDQFGAVISSTATVTATIASGTPTISAGDSIAAVAGVATFSGFTLDAVSTSAATITFSSPGLTSVTSNAITCTVTPVAVATALAIETQPGGSTSGSPLTQQPKVLVVDQFGAQISSTKTITASIFSGTATITAGAAHDAVAGAAQFTTLTLTSVATQAAALTFSASGLTSVVSAPFTVTVIPVVPDPDPIPDPDPLPDPDPIPLIATSMRIKVLPTAIISGGIISPPPEVEILDQFGAVLDVDTTVVTCTANGATVTAGGTDTTLDGVAVFNGLVVI